MPVTDAAIGKLVRERRYKKKITQEQLAAHLGLSFGMVQKYETGASPLTIVRLVEIAKFLGCRTTDLIPR